MNLIEIIKFKYLKALVFIILCNTYLWGQGLNTVVIIGAGTGGTAAAIQAARLGAEVHLLSENPWLGGMLTAAGVSATDGNHQLPSGLWGEFRAQLYSHYNGPEAVATGWVSNTHFEPKVGDSILKAMAHFTNLSIHYNTKVNKILKGKQGWAINYSHNGQSKALEARILIDATENGAILPLVGAPFYLGMDAQATTNEKEAPLQANTIVQDLTYALILKDIGKEASSKELLSKPASYNPALFACACRLPGSETPEGRVDHKQMLDYAKLPNKKYLINWPNCGNDYYLDWPNMNPLQVKKGLAAAKQHSLNFVYYIQQELGFKNLIIHNEFGTLDAFPWIPYHRESRRVKGLVQLTLNELRTPYQYKLFRTGIAVGDYPIDHHHDKNPAAPKIDFIGIKVPSYNVPLGSLIPKGVPNFIVAEKNISVSNIVNGATRLQPVVLGIGQAAGALAAMAARQSKTPKDIGVRKVQDVLLKQGVYLMPYIDVIPTDPAFEAIQKIGATGILKGKGVPYKWANQTWFYPNSLVSEYQLIEGLKTYYPTLENVQGSGIAVGLTFLNTVLKQTQTAYKRIDVTALKAMGLEIVNKDHQAPLTKRHLAQILHYALNPFAKPVNHLGVLIP